MANMLNTLFPPVVSTFMPAFKEGESAKVYFSFSPLSNPEVVEVIQVSVVDQRNNQNALVDTTGLLFFSAKKEESSDIRSIKYDELRQMYFFEIEESDLQGGKFLPEQYYKVQLRFDTSKDAKDFCKKDVNTGSKENYLISAIQKGSLSEWSSVCLIKAIYTPSLQLSFFNVNEVSSFYEGNLPVIGSVIFSGETSSERVQSFEIEVLNEKNIIVFSSEKCFPESINKISYFFTTQNFESEDVFGNYTLVVKIITSSLYEFSTEFDFKIVEPINVGNFELYDPDNPIPNSSNIQVKFNKEEGVASFRVATRLTDALSGNLYIKRASSESNFTKWENFKKINISSLPGSILDVKILDNTVTPFVWYRYSCQYENEKGLLLPVKETDIVFADFETTSLMRQDRQLNLLYNCNVSNYKNTVSRTKTDTLGGKYPRFTENAILNYKQFSLSGTISSEADFNQKFLNKKEYFKDVYDYYKLYLKDKGVPSLQRNDVDFREIGVDEPNNPSLEEDLITSTTVNDWLWERAFREEVISWLNDGEPKLFRSLTEGAVPVILTDINLTPKTQLGRMLYDFSATAYQVGDGKSFEELVELGIVITETSDDQKSVEIEKPQTGGRDTFLVEKPGQLLHFEGDSTNIIDTIANDLNLRMSLVKEKETASKIESGSYAIKNIKIFYETPPHFFFFSDSYLNGVHWEGQTNDTQGNSIYPISTEDLSYTPNGNIRYSKGTLKQGYKLSYNSGKNIFVNKRGYYQFPENVKIQDLILNGEPSDKATIEYVVSYNQYIDSFIDSIVATSVDRTVIGQIKNLFSYGEKIGEQVKRKYSFYTGNQQQYMKSWKGISIEAAPYSIFHVQYVEDQAYNEETDYLIGKTGVFHLIKDYEVQDLQFKGRRMFKANSSPSVLNSNIKDYEFLETEELVSEVLTPKRNHVYQIKEGEKIIAHKIFYMNDWYDFEFEEGKLAGIAKVPVEANVNYHGDVLELTLSATNQIV